ncbi:MAG: spermidine/putrescine ABC transporter substrate-binding protein [Acidimicrobiales bacterium]|jgi:spermidine/putrescine transport system substrate-binding protein|nr:spermidine/putrescine ABC transporter substrate-binding protein [Acidimicrobiales bacterium]
MRPCASSRRLVVPQLAVQRSSRRRFLGQSAVLVGGIALGPGLLAACGDDDESGGGGGGGSLAMLNWPLYIEDDDPSTSPTIIGFEEATGISIDYRAEIDGNESFYEKYGPDLEAGRGIGFDLVVLTAWKAAQMIEAGQVQAFDDANFPNKANVIASQASTDYDPDRQYSIPWAIGQTAFAYYPEKTGRELTSAADMFDPAFAGKVTILDEMRDAVGLTLLGMGEDPSTASLDQMLAAVDRIAAAREDGQFRDVTGNDYTEDLQLGDTWIAMAWSGDIASLKADNPDLEGLEYFVPEEGAMSFVDNAMVPIGAANKANAEKFLDHVYDPAVAGPLYESINYVPPVEGALDNMSEEARNSPFINPPAGAKLYEFRILTPEEDEELNRAFVAATQQ